MSIAQQVIVPFYIYPTDAAVLAQITRGYPTASTIIFNPDSGPGVLNAAYTAAIATAHTAGVSVLGYVHSTYGARLIADVETDVTTWYSLYPTIDGIFVDETFADSAHLSYYTTLYNFIKAAHSGHNTVLLNPGVVPSDQGFASIADTICIFENSYAGWQTNWHSVKEATWIASYPASRWYVIVHDMLNEPQIEEVIQAAKAANCGRVYLTDAGGGNPYGVVPSQSLWSQELVYAASTQPTLAMIASGRDGNITAKGR